MQGLLTGQESRQQLYTMLTRGRHANHLYLQVVGPPGTHSSALVREIAVWRAANGINPQDPRPTGGTQLEMLPALWKQRLDRDIARATNPPADARADKPQDAPHSVHGTSGSARTKNPNGVPAGRPHPADSTPQSSNRGAPNTRLHSTRRQDRQQHAAESGSSFRSRAGFARPNGVCPRFAAGRAAVWVSAPRGSGGRRLLN